MPSNADLKFVSSLKKLKGDNWSDWSDVLEDYLTVLGYTLPQESSETSTLKPEEEKILYSIISLTISDSCRRVIKSTNKSGSAAWAALKKKYCRDTPSSRLTLRSEFYFTKFDPKTEDVTTFIDRILTIADKLGNIGHRPNDTEITDKILMSLDSSFGSIRVVLSHQTPAPSIDKLTDALKEFENQEKLRTKSPTRSPSPSEEAHAAKDYRSKKRGGAKPSYTDFDWGNTQDREGACWRCGRSGHISRYCVTDMPPEVKERILKKHHETAAAAQADTDFESGSELAYVFHHSSPRPPSFSKHPNPAHLPKAHKPGPASNKHSRSTTRRSNSKPHSSSESENETDDDGSSAAWSV